jgi:hypothetical protein
MQLFLEGLYSLSGKVLNTAVFSEAVCTLTKQNTEIKVRLDILYRLLMSSAKTSKRN